MVASSLSEEVCASGLPAECLATFGGVVGALKPSDASPSSAIWVRSRLSPRVDLLLGWSGSEIGACSPSSSTLEDSVSTSASSTESDFRGAADSGNEAVDAGCKGSSPGDNAERDPCKAAGRSGKTSAAGDSGVNIDLGEASDSTGEAFGASGDSLRWLAELDDGKGEPSANEVGGDMSCEAGEVTEAICHRPWGGLDVNASDGGGP